MYGWAEIRAYERKPFVLTTSMMSSNNGVNISFLNALSLSMYKATTIEGTEALTNDAYFDSGTCGAASCFLKFDFGKSLYIKAVMFIFRLSSRISY